MPDRTADAPPDDWRAANRANWDERTGIHLKADFYDLTALREGRGRLYPIEEAELGSVEGLRVLHLQCHFGQDTLTLAQRSAEVVGLDFSKAAVDAATALATELGLETRARFVEADLYDAPAAIPEPASFDLVFVTWGAICWLPDIKRWAEIVAHFLKPGGALYLAETHPITWAYDDDAKGPDGRPGFFVPYFDKKPFEETSPLDYADPEARLSNARAYCWQHTLGDIVTELIEAGLTIRWLHEHDAIPYKGFDCLVPAEGGLYRWPDKPWLPLGFSLRAER